MERFVQLHLLTAYPPANLNRDDLGRPKTALVGGAERLRISSQSLKRAWRASDLFQEKLKGHIGTRTKRMGEEIFHRLAHGGIAEKQAREWARQIAAVFGKLKKSKDDGSIESLHIEQLAHFSPEELTAIDALVQRLIKTKEEPSKEDLNLLRERHSAADIALFGRMLADAPRFNTEAACQVAHAITVHRVAVEDDFYTAVDDLNRGEEDVGAGHMGETEFGAGLFYLYLCLDRALLLENLNGDAQLAERTIEALVASAATVAPTGKQNSFASRARASYILCEKGNAQPRSLAVAFLKPVEAGSKGLLANAVQALEDERRRLDSAYGDGDSDAVVMNTLTGQGSLADILAYAKGGLTDG
ncbi:Cse4 family CRISPR-associated protein [Hydrogenophilus thermoluteolus]|uniref:type I-E CRISPR-associated protein Cas7/Cse4/CasC n=1 Tax=Hydrogenophilus thermoluteolus TaxID=297 RepID=UPI0024A0FFB7|nr:type I-E CRISPR-associated protein Cas7/Cse4/CasC [Hydrogenophilus thermoluteolus]GLW59742.1 Cse4 family CRISPR-associated protein [Hydrogenophilus thermoluteolus]